MERIDEKTDISKSPANILRILILDSYNTYLKEEEKLDNLKNLGRKISKKNEFRLRSALISLYRRIEEPFISFYRNKTKKPDNYSSYKIHNEILDTLRYENYDKISYYICKFLYDKRLIKWDTVKNVEAEDPETLNILEGFD